jgi:hypothetical protein
MAPDFERLVRMPCPICYRNADGIERARVTADCRRSFLLQGNQREDRPKAGLLDSI